MSENTKRLLTLVIAVSMLVSMMPLNVSAQEQVTETPSQEETVQPLPEIKVEVDNPLAASNSPETATPLSLDAWYYADISEQGQKVYFSFTPTESGTYMMRADINDSAYIELLDADGNVLNTGWGGNSLGQDPLVYNELTAEQTYYYAVSFDTYAWETTGTIPVALSYSTLTNLEFEPIALLENTGGYDEEYGYYYEPNHFLADFHCTATFSDGTTLTSSGDGFTYNGLYYGIWGYPNQSAENPWTVGNTYAMEVSCMGLTFDVPVSIVPSPVVSLTVQPITVMENTCGMESSYWDQETDTEVPFYQYVEWQLMHETSFTATLSDGTVINSNTHTYEYNGETCYLELETNQYDDPWTVGNTYTMKVTMMGKTIEVPVTIIPVPLVSLSFTPVSVIEHTTGGISQEWNPDTQQYDKVYYAYSTWDILNKSTYTATFTDGTVLTGSDSGLEYNGQWYEFSCYSVQGYENQWTAGNTYNLSVTLMEKTVHLPVTITPSPVVSLEIAPISVVKDTCGYENNYWDNETQTDVSYYHYSEWQLMWETNFTATLNDGTVITGNRHHFEYNGETHYFDLRSEQDYHHQWTVGNTYTMQVTMLGKTVEVPVTITDIPLVSLEFTPVTIMEGTHGSWTQSSDPETGEFGPPKHNYDAWSIMKESQYTATFIDGTTLTGSGNDGGLNYDGKWYEFSCSAESDTSSWVFGNTYVCNISCMGKTAQLPVTITKSPLVSLSADPITIIEGTNGHWETYYDGTQEQKYFRYSEWQLMMSANCTATFDDGTVTRITSTNHEYNGETYWMSYFSNQGSQKQWTAGNTYTMYVYTAGKYVQIPVTICKSPIVSVEFDPILLAENQDGYWDSYWGESGHVEFFRYSWQSNLRYTITMEDGTTVTGNQYGFTYNDKHYDISIGNDQSWENPWLPGNTYAVDVKFPGYETQVAISVCAAATNDSYSYIVQGGKAIITDCHLTDKVIQIPDTIDGNTVVGITYLGYALDHVLELSIPDSVTMISEDVFGILGYYEEVNVPLQKLHLGSGISGVSPDMLMWLKNLEQITVSAENQLYTSVDGVLYNKDITEMIVYPFGKTSHHVIPDSVEYIDVIFEYGDNYKAISYQLGSGIKDYAELDGVIYTKDMTQVVACTARAPSNYVMPDSVTDIKNLAFANSQLTSVTVSPNVTSIVYGAFLGCENLESITLPENLQAIEMLAFDSCTSLQSISIPESVIYIGSSAFYDCYRLSAVYAESLESWCSICFEGSDANPLKFAEKLYIDGQLLTDLVIPNVSDLVYDYAFYNAQLNSITVPSYVYYIGRSAFYGTTAETLTLNENLEGINPKAFATSSIQSVELPDSLRYLGYQAFFGCEDLKELTFGNQLVEIGSDSFAYTGLTSVVLPENIEYVGSCAFQNSKLKEVTFNCKNVYIGDNAFENCPLGDLDLQENIQGFDYESFAGTLATKVNIPSTVTGLTYREFAFSYNLVSVTIPDSVEHIGDECFRGDVNLSHVLYTGTEEQWNNIAIGSQEILDAMVHFEATGDEVTTQQTCTQVSFYCSICEQWETVNKVKANHNMVDGTCTVCGHVGDWEYQIDETANTVTITGYSGSDGNLEIPETIQGKPVTAIASGAFANVSGIYGVSLPDNLEEIGVGAFKNAPHLYEVSFGEGLKVIDDFAFAGCERLNEMLLPEGLEVIGKGAFDSCYWLNYINVPSTVTTIGDYAFDGCYHLEKIELPDGLKRIGDYTFYGTLIQSINIPDTVTEIGYGAFQWCERLESVTIPASVTEIGYDAFSENFCLSLIIFEGDAPEIAPIAFSGVCADALYDADNDSWTEDVLRGYNGELYWLGCSAPRITKQPKDVYADESGMATVYFECRGNALNLTWWGAMPGEDFELLGHGDVFLSMPINKSNSGFQVFCELTDPLGRTVTTKTVTMKLAPTMTGIEITKLPNTVEYDLNQTLRNTGMVVMAHYSDGTKMELNSFDVSGYRPDESGVQTITVAYGDFTDTYTVTVKAEVQNFTSTEQKIEISAPVGAIETGAELVVEEVNVLEQFPEIPPIILDNEYIVYDIGFEKEGEAVQPTEEVEVSIPVPDYMAGMGCKIFYVDDQNNAVDMEARFEDGFMVFTVPHFSYYAIVQMPGVHITGQITGADNAVVNLKQGDEVVHTTQAEDGIYNFECVAEGLYTLEIVADELDPYITELLVGMKDIARDILMMILGDFTGDKEVTNEDVIHLLWHTLFPDSYPVAGKADFTGDGEINNEDVIYMLWHTLFPETYPLS